MKNNQRYTKALYLLVALLILLTSNLSKAGIYLQDNDFDQDWIDTTQQITFSIQSDGDSSISNIAIFIGKTDVSILFSETSAGKFTYLSPLPLPAGENELIVYKIITHKQWDEIGRIPIRVKTQLGFKVSEIKPKLELSLDSQWDEGHSTDAGAPERHNFHDVRLQTGLSTHHERENIKLTSDFNIQGSTNRRQALRFNEKGNNADKYDLSDYLVELNLNDSTRLAVGNVTYGTNELLINGINNRGVTGSHTVNEYADISFASQNGTNIVGWDNFFGLNDFDHNISSTTLGLNLLQNFPGNLRTELSYMTGETRSDSNFDVGQVRDSEKSHGYGIRVIASTEDERLRGEFNFARSTYTNPDDPFLEQTDNDVSVKVSEDNALKFHLAYDLLQNYQLTESLVASLTFDYTFTEIDALYKSLAAFPGADLRINAYHMNGTIGYVNFQFQHIRQVDNLDNIASILTTKTHSNLGDINIPLASIFSSGEDIFSYLPTLTISATDIHQFASNNPATTISDFNGASHLPDQLDTTYNIGVSWYFDNWNAAYQYSYSLQDNRQTGREKADFKRDSHQVTLGFQPINTLNIAIALGLSENHDREQSIRFRTYNSGLNLNWSITDEWSIAGNYNFTFDKDSADSSTNTSHIADIQTSYRFEIPTIIGKKLPGQFFVRYSNQNNVAEDNVFGFNSKIRTWAITSGLSISVF